MFGQEYANEILSRLEKDPHPRVLVYVDPDIDGVVAARLIMAFLDERGIPYQWFSLRRTTSTPTSAVI